MITCAMQPAAMTGPVTMPCHADEKKLNMAQPLACFEVEATFCVCSSRAIDTRHDEGVFMRDKCK